MELTAAGHAEHISRVKIDTQTHVDLKLSRKALAQLSRGDELAFAAGERRIIDEKIQCNGRLVYGYRGQGFGPRIGGDRFPDVDIGKPGDDDDVARRGTFCLKALEPMEAEHLRDLPAPRLSRGGFDEDGVTRLEHPFIHTRDSEAPEEIVVCEIEGLKPRGFCESRRVGGGRHMRENGIQKRREVLRIVREFEFCDTLLAYRVDDRKIRLHIGGTELQKKFEDIFLALRRICGRLVYFVDDDNGFDTELERLL